MTHEERAKRIKWIFFLVLLLGMGAGLYYYPKPAPETVPMEVQSPENGLLIVHHHLPGDPASDQIAHILSEVQRKYHKEVIVSTVDFKKEPEVSKKQGVTRPPHVVMITGSEKVFEFQGLWTQAKVERKVEEILHGLKRVGKDWRPPVPGMTPAGS